MKKKLIITETQLKNLSIYLTENTHSNLVKQMKTELDANYEPISKFVRAGGEYYEKPMITVKVDGEIITPKDLYNYIKNKYDVGVEFIKQVISDWIFGRISDDYRLSKNVSFN